MTLTVSRWKNSGDECFVGEPKWMEPTPQFAVAIAPPASGFEIDRNGMGEAQRRRRLFRRVTEVCFDFAITAAERGEAGIVSTRH